MGFRPLSGLRSFKLSQEATMQLQSFSFRPLSGLRSFKYTFFTL